MSHVSTGSGAVQFAPVVMTAASTFPPQAMAGHLRRTSGTAALCFAQAMHDGSAWANEAWGAYWADVIRLV